VSNKSTEEPTVTHDSTTNRRAAYVSDAVWTRLKVRAVERGVSVGVVLEEAIEQYLKTAKKVA
jgi:hypothetical protein